jgi:hypothetical protein
VRDTKSGPTELQDGNQRMDALASMYCYVWKFSPDHFVVWHHRESKQTGQRSGSVQFALYNAALQKPISDLDSALRLLHSEKQSFVASEPPLAEYEITSDRAPGSYDLKFPVAFASCPELFVLIADHSWDTPQLHLWIIDPIKQTIQIVSQDWFTTGPYDFGYQWVTRVNRDPESHCLVGDGIRIGQFVLNEGGSRFLRWLNL